MASHYNEAAAAVPPATSGRMTPRERGARVVATLIFAISAAVTWNGVQAMSGAMPLPGGWQMSMVWMAMPGATLWTTASMFLVMWQAMMIAMMLPSTWPMLELYHRVVVSMGRKRPGLALTVAAAGYFTVLLAFGVVVFAVGYSVSEAAMKSTAVGRALPFAAGILLILAGAYQVTAFKRACLTHCRSPLSFLGHAWKPGLSGAFRVGLHHGAYCAGCCGALMAMQTVLGIMNLAVMILIAAVIALEKLWKRGPLIANLAGAASAAFGLYLVIRTIAR
jgi:predicted metal-binding membrane protein